MQSAVCLLFAECVKLYSLHAFDLYLIYVLDFYCVHVNTLLFAAYAFGFYLQSAFDLIRSVFDFVCSVIVFVMYVFLVCSVVTNGPPYIFHGSRKIKEKI